MTLNPLHFSLVRMSLLHLATPMEFEHTNGAIVVQANKEKRGATATGFVPDRIITGGAQTRKQLMLANHMRAWVWAAKDININADDMISSSELMEKLQELIRQKYFGQLQNTLIGQAFPYVVEVYPFENYFVFSMKADTYRQAYILNPVDRTVAITGLPQRVEQMFVNAAGDSKQYMQRVDTGVRYAFAPPMGNSQSATTGARNSELSTCIIRNYNDINARVNAYLAAIKSNNYTPIAPSFDPALLGKNGRVYGLSTVVASLYKKGINAFDFAHYLAMKAEKKCGCSK